MSSTPPVYRRILLKLSGEALLGKEDYGIDPEVLRGLAAEIIEVSKAGVQIGLVVGGGNIFRGVEVSSRGVSRTTGDTMGMLATVMNALALQDALEKAGVFTRVQSAIEMQEIAEPYIRRRAERHLEKGRVVIFAAGVGAPYFTTDSGAALRAAEMQCDALLKGTSVDGVYDSDPKTNPAAKRYRHLSFQDALQKQLKVMDSTAFSLCLDNKMPIQVFDMGKEGNLKRAVQGQAIGTLIDANGESVFYE